MMLHFTYSEESLHSSIAICRDNSILLYTIVKLNRPTQTKMATSIQVNLLNKNAEYASTFTQGDLALPPAKKYAVCM